MENIEVGTGRFDHKDVGSLVLVEEEFAGGFAGVGGIDLVGCFGEGFGSGGLSAAHGIAERPVEGAVKFGGIGDDAGLGKAGLIEVEADCADAAIHHIGRGDEVGTGLGLEDGHAGEDLDGAVIIDLLSIEGEDPIMAMGSVGIEGDIGPDLDLREVLFEEADGAEEEGFGVEGLIAFRGFKGRLEGGEEGDGVDAEGEEAFGFVEQIGKVEAMLARHGFDGFGGAVAIDEEEGLDELARVQGGFADHGANGFGAAEAARARGTVGDCHELVG